MNTVRTDKPSMLFRLRQKLISFLNASVSNTLCSAETTYASRFSRDPTAVMINNVGFVSKNIALMSSKSLSVAAPIAFCISSTVPICPIICPLKNPKALKEMVSGSSARESLIGIKCLFISTNSFTSTFGVYVMVASSR